MMFGNVGAMSDAGKRELVTWCYRIYLGREPECSEVTNKPFSSFEELRALFEDSEEFAITRNQRHPEVVSFFDKNELILWCYRILRGCDPECSGIYTYMFSSLPELRNHIRGLEPPHITEHGIPGANAHLSDNGMYIVSNLNNDSGRMFTAVSEGYSIGKYEATFHFRNFPRENPDTLITIEIVHDDFQPLAIHTFSSVELSSGQSKSITFYVIDPQRRITFGIVVAKSTPLEVCRNIDVTQLSDNIYGFIEGSENLPIDYQRLVTQFMQAFMNLQRLGGAFHYTQNKLIATIDGINFRVQDQGDLQVLNEIFSISVYNMHTPYKAIAIDVGMNVGVATLFLAKSPSINSVYSFEPFPMTYQRALENIELNPDLKGKIQPQNCAWDTQTRHVTVDYDPNGSIAMSVRNQSGTSSVQASIHIVSAADMLLNIVNKEPNTPIVMKMDCEGSEYDILAQLDREKLLHYISVLMLEYHSGISPEKFNEFLFGILVKNGFVVLDCKNSLNRCGSMLYAVNNAAYPILS